MFPLKPVGKFFLASGDLLVSLVWLWHGFPWLVDASLQSLISTCTSPVSLHIIFSLCVSLSKCPIFYKNTCYICLGPRKTSFQLNTVLFL